MENHPIPQDVTGFQFKLIGNMTVKQFAYLATAVVLAWVFFQLPVSFLIKFPFCAFLVILGIGLAFFPVSGRPMDLMIGHFIKALFRPTQFLYEKSGTTLFPKRVAFAPLPKDKPKIHLQSPSLMPVITPNLNTPPKPAAPPLTPQPLMATPTIKLIKPTPREFRNTGFPSIPDSPNLITGIVKDPRGNPLSNILVEVKDKESNPVRAFKTNEVGRFASATPLLNGNYTLAFEDPKGQNRFEVKTIDVTGQIIMPIETMSIDTREELRRSLFATSN